MSKKRGKRVGILTSGGDAPGMNAAVRAVFRRVKDLDPHNEVVLFKEGLNGLAGRLEVNYLGNIERDAIRGIIHKGGTFIGTGRIPELKPPPEGVRGRGAVGAQAQGDHGRGGGEPAPARARLRGGGGG